MPLICHLFLASHAVQCASAHEQDDVTALQPTHSGKGGQAHLLEQADYANVNSLKNLVQMRQLNISWLLCKACHFVQITPATAI